MNSQDKNHTLEALHALLKRFDPERLTEQVTTLGEEWADKDAAASSLEETRKSMLANVLLDYINPASAPSVDGKAPRGMPISQAEHRALSDPRYETHLELMVAARREANIARVRYDMGKMRIELHRSQMATARQELRTLPM